MENKICYKDLTGKNTKIFLKKRPEPISGKIEIVHDKFIVLLQKKIRYKKENEFVYKKISVKKDKIERISVI